ncbi:MAG: beta-lactamase family protein [Desulfobacterales bacterium]|nr:beta-lactamase family protein [Desulfobacterales bacterium]
MKSILKWSLCILVLVPVAGALYYLDHALPIGTGYSAKYICSQLFLAQRDPDQVFREDVKPTNPLFRLVSIRVNYEGQSVTARALGFWKPMTALYRDGCGCTLAVGTELDALRDQARGLGSEQPPRPAPDQTLPWPRGDAPGAAPLPPGVNRAKLSRAMDDFFTEPGPESQRNTQAVVIVLGDEIIAERYAPGFTKETPMIGWSMSKSVTGALVGILVGDGLLDLHSPAPVAAWQGRDDPRKAITLDMLLRMSSGLAFTETYAPFKDATAMLYQSPSMAAVAATKSLAFPVDTHWSYSSGTTNILADIVFNTLGGDLGKAQTFIQTRLFDRMGATSAVMEPDPAGRFVGSSYMFATARDWAGSASS